MGYNSFQLVNQAAVSNDNPSFRSTESIGATYQFEMDSSGPFGSDLSGNWLSPQQALNKYKNVSLGYTWLSVNGRLSKYRLGRLITRIINKITYDKIPGWYDTHTRIELNKH